MLLIPHQYTEISAGKAGASSAQEAVEVLATAKNHNGKKCEQLEGDKSWASHCSLKEYSADVDLSGGGLRLYSDRPRNPPCLCAEVWSQCEWLPVLLHVGTLRA